MKNASLPEDTNFAKAAQASTVSVEQLHIMLSEGREVASLNP